MLNIQIICVGKVKETYLKEAILEYSKRLSKYIKLDILELPDEKIPDKINDNIIDTIKTKECNNIINHLKKDSYIIALDLKGKEFSSEEFSKNLDKISMENSHITFIIGGSHAFALVGIAQADVLLPLPFAVVPLQSLALRHAALCVVGVVVLHVLGQRVALRLVDGFSHLQSVGFFRIVNEIASVLCGSTHAANHEECRKKCCFYRNVSFHRTNMFLELYLLFSIVCLLNRRQMYAVIGEYVLKYGYLLSKCKL